MKTRQFEELDVPDFADHTRAFLKIKKVATTSVHSVLFLGRVVCQ